MSKSLNLTQYKDAAGIQNCEPATIYAIAQVESGGNGGFLPEPDGRIVVRLENHKLWEFWGKANPDTFHAHFRFGKPVFKQHKVFLDGIWRMQHVGDAVLEWRAFELACSQDREAALLSTSFGMFQPMGFNYKRCGYGSVEEMFADLQESEERQLWAFIRFCQASGAQFERALRERDFAVIARLYNGSGQVQTYSRWMEAAYKQAQHILW